MVESWLLRKRVEARILVQELAEALHPDDGWGSEEDWSAAGFDVERS